MTDFVSIQPIANQQELNALVAAARADAHEPILPTHIFWRGNEVVGYAGIMAMVPPGRAPVAAHANLWFHSQKLSARETFGLINSLENIARATCGTDRVLVPCGKDSPFADLMGRMGFVPLLETVIYVRTAEHQRDQKDIRDLKDK